MSNIAYAQFGDTTMRLSSSYNTIYKVKLSEYPTEIFERLANTVFNQTEYNLLVSKKTLKIEVTFDIKKEEIISLKVIEGRGHFTNTTRINSDIKQKIEVLMLENLQVVDIYATQNYVEKSKPIFLKSLYYLIPSNLKKRKKKRGSAP